MTALYDKVLTTTSHGKWCEKTTETSPAHVFYKSAITHNSPPHLIVHLIGKRRHTERIKSNQWALGTLHKPYACVADDLPNHRVIYVSLILFFTVIMLISYHNSPEHVLCRHWWFLVRIVVYLDGVFRWGGMERCCRNYPSRWQYVHRDRTRNTLLWAVSCVGLHVSQPCQGFIIFINLLLPQGQQWVVF